MESEKPPFVKCLMEINISVVSCERSSCCLISKSSVGEIQSNNVSGEPILIFWTQSKIGLNKIHSNFFKLFFVHINNSKLKHILYSNNHINSTNLRRLKTILISYNITTGCAPTVESLA